MTEITLPKAHGHWLLPLLRVLCWPLLFLLGPCRYIGTRHVPRKGGLLVIANHLSDCDPVILQAACPRAIQFMGKSELFTMKIVGPILKWWGSFPVKRGSPDRNSLRLAAELAKSGQTVGIFPEGQLSENSLLQEIKPGAALIIKMAKVPVICCGLSGTPKIVPYGSTWARPALSWVTAHWGEPKVFDEEASNDEIVAWIEAQLRELTGQQT